jgi:NAD(P)-dependent dehydrogenase (short-subunit alcohol dehydrogenase family)
VSIRTAEAKISTSQFENATHVIYIFSGCSKLAILDLSEEQSSLAANALVRNLVEAGKVDEGEIDAIGYGVDVAEEKLVAKTMQDIVERWGRIDCLVTSAGESRRRRGCFAPRSIRVRLLSACRTRFTVRFIRQASCKTFQRWSAILLLLETEDSQSIDILSYNVYLSTDVLRNASSCSMTLTCMARTFALVRPRGT